MAALITIPSLVSSILEDLPHMAQTKRFNLEYRLYHPSAETDKISVAIELTKSTIRDDFYDASIVVSDYCYEVKQIDHVIKFSIVARQCLFKNELSKISPDRELTLHSCNAKGKPNCLTFQEIAVLERELRTEVCHVWIQLLKA